MNTRPMEPRDVHEHMREVVEADEFDIAEVGARLAHVERIRTNWASHDGEEGWSGRMAAEWHEAYDNARRYVEQTLERRERIGAVVVDLALEQAAAVDRERELSRRLERLETAMFPPAQAATIDDLFPSETTRGSAAVGTMILDEHGHVPPEVWDERERDHRMLTQMVEGFDQAEDTPAIRAARRQLEAMERDFRARRDSDG